MSGILVLLTAYCPWPVAGCLPGFACPPLADCLLTLAYFAYSVLLLFIGLLPAAVVYWPTACCYCLLAYGLVLLSIGLLPTAIVYCRERLDCRR